MRMAYIVFMPSHIAGIEGSIRGKAEAWAAMGADVDVIVLNPDIASSDGPVRLVRANAGRTRVGRFRRSLFSRFDVIERSLDIGAYDLVFLRYPCADSSGLPFMRKYPVVLEFHSAMLAEMNSHLDSPLPLPVRAVKHIRIDLERRHGPNILQNAHGIIGVTDEICRLELERAGADIPALTAPNGIHVDAVPATGFLPFDGRHLHIAFVGSLLNPWHGLDRFTRGLASYRGQTRITLHLIGNISKRDLGDCANANVETHFHGTLDRGAMTDVLKGMNVAISSLALFRKKLEEACDLKSREYTARGLPFIIGHRDPDLEAIDDSRNFLLQLPNTSAPVDVDQLFAFVESFNAACTADELRDYMRAYAGEHLDWAVKVPKYVEFGKALLGTSDSSSRNES